MIRSALRTRCMTRFRDPNNDIYTAADWNDYLVDAQGDVFAASPWWPFFETLGATNAVTTTGLLTLPTDAWRVNSVFNTTDGYALTPLSGRADFLDAYDPITSVGSPQHYRLRGNVLEVLPRPASTVNLRIEYMGPPAFLAADGDEPIWPEQYHQILVSGALARAYEDDGNPGQAQIHWAKFGALLEQMKNDLLGTRSESYYGLPDIW